jgi:NAD(P)-dependent dehydrogenase (short-subunit alcohol dehydrogenase family)
MTQASDGDRDKTGFFVGLTVAVTGAGRGLGRQYCIDLAAQGANVLACGRGSNVEAVVREISAQGGTAAAALNVADPGARAVETFGGVDALIVNAGGVRDRSFAKMTDAEWREVMDVHLEGARAAVASVWPIMIARGRGRIVLTTSGAGLHGNFGQANYAAAKAAIVGFMKTLAFEGARHDVLTNAVAPMALTDMTDSVFTPGLAAALRPEMVSPFVLALCHPSSRANGAVIEVGGGWASALRWQRSQGVRLQGPALTPSTVLSQWRALTDFDVEPDYPQRIEDCLEAAASDRGLKIPKEATDG